MTQRAIAIFGLGVLLACACEQGHAIATQEGHRVAGPRFFASGQRNPYLMAAIRRGVDREISFAGHFSQAYVGCGTGCGSFWFVDRRTGAVLEGPNEAAEGQMIWDVRTRADSDVVTVVYGSRDGLPGRCSTQAFRWTGRAFTRLSDPGRSPCPD